jgi:predicted RNA-binding protein with PUA-like domain
MKCEPAAYTIDDLARDTRTGWEGVRNYRARNFMRDQMQEGIGPLLCVECRPIGRDRTGPDRARRLSDPFAWRRGHQYYNAASTPAKPIWYTVDLEFVERFPSVVPLDTLRETPGLEEMIVIKKGSRLSVQPVTRAEFAIVTRLGRRAWA